MQQPTRLLSNELRDQQEGKATRWAVFCVFWEDCLVSERVFMPDCTYFLVPELTEPGRGEQPASCPNGCLFLMSPRPFHKTLYIDTKKAKILDIAVCSATSVESCLCLKARKVWQRGRLRRWGRRRSDAELQRFNVCLSQRKFVIYGQFSPRRRHPQDPLHLHPDHRGIHAPVRGQIPQSCLPDG